MRLHHVQVACPPGGEEAVRQFYGAGLGLAEVAKPAGLAGRGGVWFRGEGYELHVGVEDPFSPARKAHPAFELGSVAELDGAAERLASLGFEVDHGERHSFPGFERVHTRDAHGNRVELLSR
jgi:catechol 2,3-dioxygenase-like lactoylglutathione lyase family enzyme